MHSGISEKSRTKTKQLFLIDGYGFVFRAYHSMPPLTRPDGTPVGAVYGFTNMIMKLKSKVSPDNGHHMLVVFDSGRKTFRNDIYPEYKANRPPAPEDLIPQFPLVRAAAEALGLPVSSSDGYEADDIIATYARLAKEQGIKVTIISSDKDLMQLIDDDVEMYDAMKDKRVGEKEVEEKFGVPPAKLLDVMALIGDSSDNVPGVPGIGVKTAAELIKEYGSLDELLKRAGEIKQNKRRETLLENAEKARLSRQLITLCNTVEVDSDIEKLSVVNEDPEVLIEFLSAQGFKSLVTKIERKHGVEAPKNSPAITEQKPKKKVEKQYYLIENKNALSAWLAPVKNVGRLVVFPVMEGEKLAGVALAYEQGQACFLPLSDIAKKQKGEQISLDFSEETSAVDINILEPLSPLLSDPSILKIGHDIKPVMHLIGKMAPLDDTMVISYVLDGARHKHDIANLAQIHTGEELPSIDKKSLKDADGETLRDVFCSYADSLISLHTFLRRNLFAEKMLTLYENMERPLIPILFDMEKCGVETDKGELEKLSGEFGKRIDILEKEIHKIAGEEFNIGSPKQLGDILFNKMGLEGGKKSSKTGARSTGADVLEALSVEGHEIAGEILQWRELSKLKNTYTDALAKQIEDGRIHTSYSMTVAATGRLSSISPNLQNIPIRSEEGRKIRKAFIAKEGCKLISADYSQIELRLLAHIADMKVLKDAFRDKKDIHATTASQVFGVDLDKVNAEMRRRAKTINFGIIYGQSAFGLANQLGIGRKEAKELIDAYFKQYPGIRDYMEKMKEKARNQGYIITLFGRKCYIPDINDKNHTRRAFAERAAINYPLQGSAADIIKKAMIRVSNALKTKDMETKMLLQVHDELILEAPEKEAENAAALVKKEMESVISLSVPITAEAKTGDNWGEIH